MAAGLSLLLAAVFGAGDQYLGSLSAHPWGADVSLLSAPWLLLPFLAGWAQPSPRRAALVGLACTAAALLGYALMTLSPVENAQLTLRTATGFAVSERPVLLGGLVTGPLFGVLGHRWHAARAWFGGLLAAAALVLEPLARTYHGDPIRFRTVWLAEVAAGLAMAAYVSATAARSPRRARSSAGS